MRLKATEDDVYRLMDRREQSYIAVALCSIAEGISSHLLIYQKRCWDLAYLCGMLAVAIVLFIRQVFLCSRRIMEAECCYMELDTDSLAVCQPEKNGHYEACRIFCVRSFGFDHHKFIEFYRRLRWMVPGKVRIIGTKHQNVWNMRRAHAGICVAAGMILGYIIPKIIEVMELF